MSQKSRSKSGASGAQRSLFTAFDNDRHWWQRLEFPSKKLRDFSIFLFFTVAAYRLATQEIVVPSFTFSDFLSLTLALFAIGMSSWFFFRASETSNRFYDNTYHFTKDISETLGRIEERFGERLLGLQEQVKLSYSNTRMDPEELQKKEEELQAKIAELQTQEENYESQIEDLIEKSQLTEEEKESYKREVAHAREGLQEQKQLVRTLRRELEGQKSLATNLPEELYDYLREMPHAEAVKLLQMSGRRISSHIARNNPDVFGLLHHYDLVDEEGQLTNRIVRSIRECLSGMFSS